MQVFTDQTSLGLENLLITNFPVKSRIVKIMSSLKQLDVKLIWPKFERRKTKYQRSRLKGGTIPNANKKSEKPKKKERKL